MDFTFLLFLIPAILFLCGSAYFSAAETAITVSLPSRIHQLAANGNKRAKIVEELQKDKDKLISIVLLGNNTCNTFSSVLATACAIRYLGPEGAFLAGGVMTVLVLLFAEIMPKNLALDNAESIALRLAPALLFLARSLNWVTNLIRFIVQAMRRIFGMNRKMAPISAYEELRGAISLQHKEGNVFKEDKDMLGSVLDLKEMTVDQIMIHRTKMVTINLDWPIKKIISKILASNHSRLPLYQDDPDNIVAILHVRDLLILLHRNPIPTKEDLLAVTSTPWFISCNTMVSAQLKQFQQRRSHLALIVDEFGDLQGLITLEDILEEIVGPIEDESDPQNMQIIKNHDGSYLIDGSASIRDINRLLDWNLSDEEANTIGGLIMYELERMPKINEEIVIDDIHMQIIRIRERQILLVKARKANA